jgi:WD40 repeat protein
MQVIEVGNCVFQLRFLPDSRRLVVGTADTDRRVTFEVLSLPGGERVRLVVPRANLDSWWYDAGYGNAIAPHPGGETCSIAWAGNLYAFRTADGERLPVPEEVRAHQVILSPGGERLIAAHRTNSEWEILAVKTGPDGGSVVWRKATRKDFIYPQVAGFLPDGERFVTLDGAVRIRSFATGEELATGRHKPRGTQQPQISPDGRYLAALGYGNMYVFDPITLAKPRKIGGTATFGDFRSVAIHPGGEMMAVIHGGPTLVKVYNLGTLARVRTFQWKLGPLRSVAFSPDGCLGAAGSDDGRIVVWDVDESIQDPR